MNWFLNWEDLLLTNNENRNNLQQKDLLLCQTCNSPLCHIGFKFNYRIGFEKDNSKGFGIRPSKNHLRVGAYERESVNGKF